MKYPLNVLLFYITFLSITSASAQDTKQLGTSWTEEPPKNNKTFWMASISAPFRQNPEIKDEFHITGDEDAPDWFIPNGLNLAAGYGYQLKRLLCISINSGIDWRYDEKLWSVPVYGLVTLNTHPKKNTSLTLQAGLGYNFAIGRGNLNGTYQKYRLGISNFNKKFMIFTEVTRLGFAFSSDRQLSSFSIGGAFINF